MEWFRWYHGTVTDPKWRVVARKSGRSTSDVIAVFACLLERASEHETRGTITGWDADAIGACLDLDSDAVTAIVTAMQGKVLDGDVMPAWLKRQPKREDGSAERAKEWRERKRTQANANEHREDKSREDIITPPLSPLPGEKRIKGCRLPSDWAPELELRDFATALGLDPDRLAADFRDYWLAKAGSGATKLDWNATWRVWCRKAADQKPQVRIEQAPARTGGVADSGKVAEMVGKSVRWIETPHGMRKERIA